MNRQGIGMGLAAVLAAAAGAGELERVRVAADGKGFALEPSGVPFVAWGVNYDHDRDGRLLEDYWADEWPTVEADFREIRDLGANVVRVHLQLGRFMKTAAEPDADALARLARLLALAETNGLRLDLTGLGCYHKKDVPPWYDGLAEADRWAVQARFWSAVARTGAGRAAVFCYDLMNEPILPGAKPETNWLAGELGGKFFVQRLTLDLAGRSREQVAKAWVDRMAAAVRAEDPAGLVTVGVIPWAAVWPAAKPLFYAKDVGAALDFASVHFYPKKGGVEKALKALAVYDVGKPLVIEELFPLACGLDELDAFIEGSRPLADGWIGFYWGQTVEELAAAPPDIGRAILRGWLDDFRRRAPALRAP